MNITIHASVAWVMAVFLVSLRIGPLFILSPPFSQIQVPARIRVLLVLALSACLAQAVSADIYANGGTLLVAAASELVLGLMLAFSLQVAFASLSFAGRVLDVQAGYGLAMVIDPGSKSQAPLFGSILVMTAGLIFFATGGHHEVLRLIMQLLRVMPVGHAALLDNPAVVINYFGVVMGLGISAVAAVLTVLFLVDITIAFMSRTMPQMNALMLGLQVKVIVTLVVLSLSSGLLAPVTMRLINDALNFVPAL